MMGNFDAAALLASSNGVQVGGSGVEVNGQSWQVSGGVKRSRFTTVVAPPTKSAGGESGLALTTSEFIEENGREPDVYESEQTKGLNPFVYLRGSYMESKGPDGNMITTQMATHLYIAPEKRPSTLLRLPIKARGGYVAIWTVLDFVQSAPIEQVKQYLKTDPGLQEIANLTITDAKLYEIGDSGFIQDAMVYLGAAPGVNCRKGVDVADFFNDRPAPEVPIHKQLDEAEDLHAVATAVQKQAAVLPTTSAAIPDPMKSAAPAAIAAPVAAPIVARVEEPDEMKAPSQTKKVSFKITSIGMTQHGFCAYIVKSIAEDGKGFLLIANVAGSSFTEFDPGIELQVILEGETFKCKSMASNMNVEPAGVIMQLFEVVGK